MFKRKMYSIRARDILRGIVLKSREINVKRDISERTPTISTTNTPDTTDTTERVSGKTVYDLGQPATLSDAELEISKAADAAWEDQVESLLGFVSSKEGGEWEVEGVAQS